MRDADNSPNKNQPKPRPIRSDTQDELQTCVRRQIGRVIIVMSIDKRESKNKVWIEHAPRSGGSVEHKKIHNVPSKEDQSKLTVSQNNAEHQSHFGKVHEGTDRH